jgi:hypothetical protein
MVSSRPFHPSVPSSIVIRPIIRPFIHPDDGHCVHIQNVWFCPVALPALTPLLLFLLLALTCGNRRRNQKKKKKTQATKQQQQLLLQTVLYQQRRRRIDDDAPIDLFFVCNGRHQYNHHGNEQDKQ